MRLVGLLAAALGLSATGCRNLPLEPAPRPPVAPARPERLIQPLDGAVGRVQTINERLRFVVLDYSLNPLPAIGDRLNLIRDDTVVGELKVTGPVRNTTLVADIVAGNPRIGDLTRPQPVPPANPF